jgi:hypothetical protein
MNPSLKDFQFSWGMWDLVQHMLFVKSLQPIHCGAVIYMLEENACD